MELYPDLPNVQTSTLERWLAHVRALVTHNPDLDSVAMAIELELAARADK
jgi:hypothetical protein